jgi:putative membrane protein
MDPMPRPDDDSKTPAPSATPAGLAAIGNLISRIFARLNAWGTFAARPSPRAKTANDLAEDRTRLAAERTLMAADRSLMAWVRTALSMISFGFTIYKILQGVAASGVVLGAAAQPRTVGLFLIGLGTLCIGMGTVEYLHRARELSVHGDVPIWRPSLVMAALMVLLSVFLFVGVTFRVL